MKNRLFFFIAIVSVIALLFVTGCQGGNQPGTSSVPQELVIGEQFDLGGYDPSSSMSSFVRALIFNNLVELDLDFKKSPGLAKSWDMSSDGKTWTFYLRENVVFHDGTPWNAEVAKFNLEWQMAGSGKTWLAAVDQVEVVGEHKMVVHLKVPVFTFASDLTPPFLAMISPQAIDAEGKVTAAIGTGPFKLASWTKDSEFVMERNDDYYGGAPKLEQVTFKVIPDAETRAMALEAGQIQMMSGREALTAVQRLKEKDNLKLVKRMGQTSELLFFNVYQEPFDDLRVRQAVAHAINLQTIVPTLLGDLAEPPKNFFTPAYGEFLDTSPQMPEYNVGKAKQLLAEAGWKDENGNGILEKDGKPLKATMYLGAKNEEDKLLSAVIQANLKDIGMDLELRLVEEAALREALQKKQYDMIMIGQWLVPHDDPTSHYLKGYWHSDSTYTIYTDTELDQLVEQLATSLDAGERIKMHRQIQAEVLSQTPVIVIFHRNNVMVMDKQVENFTVSVGTWQIFRGLTDTYMK